MRERGTAQPTAPTSGKGEPDGVTYICTAARYRSLAVGTRAAVLIWGELDRSGWIIVRWVPCPTLAWACSFSDDGSPRNEAEDMPTQAWDMAPERQCHPPCFILCA
jgi:hypothetical protein